MLPRSGAAGCTARRHLPRAKPAAGAGCGNDTKTFAETCGAPGDGLGRPWDVGAALSPTRVPASHSSHFRYVQLHGCSVYKLYRSRFAVSRGVLKNVLFTRLTFYHVRLSNKIYVVWLLCPVVHWRRPVLIGMLHTVLQATHRLA